MAKNLYLYDEFISQAHKRTSAQALMLNALLFLSFSLLPLASQAQNSTGFITRMPDLNGVNLFTVTMNRPNGSIATQITNTNGNYSFPNNFIGTGIYRITPTKNAEYLNGTSTLDLVQISRHILGTQTPPFDVWQIMAADINGNDVVSVADQVILRAAILGLRTEFGLSTFNGVTTTRPSWLTWSDNSFTGAYTLPALQANEIARNFSGGFPINANSNAQLSGLQWLCRKLGDTNNNANTQIAKVAKETKDVLFASASERENSNFNNSAAIGDEITLQVSLSNPNECIAWQNGLNINIDALEITNVEGIKEDFYYNNKESGVFNALNYVSDKKSISTALCFKLHLKVKQTIDNISSVLMPQNDIMESIAYSTNETEMTAPFIYTLDIKRKSSEEFRVYPNPVSDVLHINLNKTK